MNCPYCEHILKADANFCTSCGKKIDTGNHKFCQIQLLSSLPGKNVFINGVKTDYTTPCKLEHLNPGKYTFHIEDEDYYSEPQKIIIEANLIATINFEIKEKVNVRINSKHQLYLKTDNIEFASNQVIKVVPGKYVIIPQSKSLPSIKINVLSKPNYYQVEYDEHIKYMTVIFQNFPDNINLELAGKKHITDQTISIKPKGEIKYSHSSHIQSNESESVIFILPGNFYKLTWSCKSIKNEISLTESNKSKSIDFKVFDNIRRKRKKKITLWSIIILPLSLILLIGPYAYESFLWKRTTEIDTVDAYKEYIKIYYYELPLGTGGMLDVYSQYPFSKLYFKHRSEADKRINGLMKESDN